MAENKFTSNSAENFIRVCTNHGNFTAAEAIDALAIFQFVLEMEERGLKANINFIQKSFIAQIRTLVMLVTYISKDVFGLIKSFLLQV